MVANDNEQDDEVEDDESYTNGLQIFLMGFVEAEKTATRLTSDAVLDANGGKSGHSDNYDVSTDYEHVESFNEEVVGREQRRKVLDVDVIDYSPRRWVASELRRDYGERRRSSRDFGYGQQSSSKKEGRPRRITPHDRDVYSVSRGGAVPGSASLLSPRPDR